jgi:hypothetical protein
LTFLLKNTSIKNDIDLPKITLSRAGGDSPIPARKSARCVILSTLDEWTFRNVDPWRSREKIRVPKRTFGFRRSRASAQYARRVADRKVAG